MVARLFVVSVVLLCGAVVCSATLSGPVGPADRGVGAGAPGPRIAPGPFAVSITCEGKPISRVRVTFGGRYAITGQDGRVIFDGVPAGKYRLCSPRGIRPWCCASPPPPRRPRCGSRWWITIPGPRSTARRSCWPRPGRPDESPRRRPTHRGRPASPVSASVAPTGATPRITL